MATREQRAEAIKWASKVVLSWPSYMHSVVCRCEKCVRDRPAEKGVDDVR